MKREKVEQKLIEVIDKLEQSHLFPEQPPNFEQAKKQIHKALEMHTEPLKTEMRITNDFLNERIRQIVFSREFLRELKSVLQEGRR